MSCSGLDVAAGEKRLEDVGGEGHDGGRGGGKMSRPYYDRRERRENLGPDYHQFCEWSKTSQGEETSGSTPGPTKDQRPWIYSNLCNLL